MSPTAGREFGIPEKQHSNPGWLGEALVAQWLMDTGWEIWERRWRTRWGEIDLIAGQFPYTAQSERVVKGDSSPDLGRSQGGLLAFVEVKTRSPRSWDAGGLLAISPTKQAKIIQTAELFLAAHPEFADFPCRFDVALVQYQPLGRSPNSPQGPLLNFKKPVCLGQPQALGDYRFTLQDYICGAFDA